MILKITPGSKVIVIDSLSIEIILFIFSVLMMIEKEFLRGVAPPQRLVFPPWGTIEISLSLANFKIFDTSYLSWGFKIAIASPIYCPLQSFVYLR